MGRVFISHASGDQALGNALVDLLESGIGIPHDAIFYSASKTQGVPPGRNFTDDIKRQFRNAEIVLALISENYYASAFCMAELGAAWVTAKRLVPILVPPITYGSLRAVLGGIQALKIDDENDLDQLFDVTKNALVIAGVGTPRWNVRRAAFLAKVPRVLRSIGSKGPVSRAKYDTPQKHLSPRRREAQPPADEVTNPEQPNRGLKPLRLFPTRREGDNEFQQTVRTLAEENRRLNRMLHTLAKHHKRAYKFVSDVIERDIESDGSESRTRTMSIAAVRDAISWVEVSYGTTAANASEEGVVQDEPHITDKNGKRLDYYVYEVSGTVTKALVFFSKPLKRGDPPRTIKIVRQRTHRAWVDLLRNLEDVSRYQVRNELASLAITVRLPGSLRVDWLRVDPRRGVTVSVARDRMSVMFSANRVKAGTTFRYTLRCVRPT